MSRIILVRHGETAAQSSLRYWGSTDVALGDTGIRQAQKLKTRLSTEKIDAVFSSTMSRAMTTADIILAGRQVPVIPCAELREVDFGKLEGLTFNEISDLYPDVAQKWAERLPGLQYPGGEKLEDFTQRVGSFLNRLPEYTRGNQTVMVVAHSGVLRTLICQMLGIEPSRRWQFTVGLASISIVHYGNSTNTLNCLNDISHLNELASDY